LFWWDDLKLISLENKRFFFNFWNEDMIKIKSSFQIIKYSLGIQYHTFLANFLGETFNFDFILIDAKTLIWYYIFSATFYLMSILIFQNKMIKGFTYKE